MFRLILPYAREEGALVPIQILDSDHRLMLDTKGLLVTGSSDCLIRSELATKIGLRFDIPSVITISDGITTIETSMIFFDSPLTSVDVILGMTFMRHFVFYFDGPKKLVTITSE